MNKYFILRFIAKPNFYSDRALNEKKPTADNQPDLHRCSKAAPREAGRLEASLLDYGMVMASVFGACSSFGLKTPKADGGRWDKAVRKKGQSSA